LPTPTYTALATVTLGSSASSVTFSSIPATYRDLILIVNGSPSDNSYPGVTSRLNGDTGANYSRVRMGGDGTGSGGSTSLTGATNLELNSYFGLGSSTSSRMALIAQLMDYSATDKHKTVLTRSGTNTDGVEALAGRWANTAAVTTWLVYTTSAAFGAGTTFALYGIAS
jgi:hypothetical protein